MWCVSRAVLDICSSPCADTLQQHVCRQALHERLLAHLLQVQGVWHHEATEKHASPETWLSDLFLTPHWRYSSLETRDTPFKVSFLTNHILSCLNKITGKVIR